VFKLLPFLVLSLAFTLLYQLMPNTRVQWRAALVGGTVGGTLWQLNNILSVKYFSKAVTYSQIYGSLSIIPLLLVGIYTSWLILLFGAQVAYAFQNRQSYLQEKVAETVNHRGREFIALRLMTRIAQRFQAGEKPEGTGPLAETLAVPSRLVSKIVASLEKAGLLVQVVDDDTAYVPARPLEQITAYDVLQALRVGQGLELETCDDCSRDLIRGRFERIAEAERCVAGSLTLAELAQEASARTILPVAAPA
jgi:membrane protein